MNYLWGVDQLNNVFICHVLCTGDWKQVNGGLHQLDANDTEVWGDSDNDTICKRPVNGGNNWAEVPGWLRHGSAPVNGYIML